MHRIMFLHNIDITYWTPLHIYSLYMTLLCCLISSLWSLIRTIPFFSSIVFPSRSSSGKKRFKSRLFFTIFERVCYPIFGFMSARRGRGWICHSNHHTDKEPTPSRQEMEGLLQSHKRAPTASQTREVGSI